MRGADPSAHPSDSSAELAISDAISAELPLPGAPHPEHDEGGEGATAPAASGAAAKGGAAAKAMARMMGGAKKPPRVAG